ncbi:hypothetical protein NCG89_11130 [Spongiibacter taiwanensis]|uniref:hypothetical protein n=1 Tax=Spongiibacter taiwanensis TaxID=1748242 RepID=UPI0020363BF7|nr:hypothetical protein [Spongiibacter taiwanensis]USA42075.1 hypothetical protein NCG89_11130 [Spongiibacter taiwanensis]
MILKWLPIFKDVVLSLAAMTTMYVAIYGLNKWREEHQGKVRFDAAKELLSSICSVRNNFEIVRSGWLDASEFPSEYSSKHPSEKSTKDRADATWHVYKNRLEPLIEAMNSLDTTLIEGEVLWGSEVKEQGRKINASFNRLVRSIKELITEEYRGIDNPRDDVIIRYRQDVSASREAEDELSLQIRSSVKYFEELLEPYIRR